MKIKLSIFLFVVAFIVLFNSVSYSKNVKFFMLQSYSEDDLCGIPQLNGAIDTLKKADFNVNNSTIYTFFMETKRKYTTKKQIDEISEKAYEKIKETNPDIVFLFDDAAFMHLAHRLIHTHYKVVFSGINKTPEDYNKIIHFMNNKRYPTANITGVYEKLHIEKSIKFIENIIGKKGKIALLSSTDLVGKIVNRQILSELKNTELEHNLIFFTINNVTQLKSAIETINKDKSIVAYILNTESITDENGRKLNMFNAIPIAVKYAKKPDIAINSSFCKSGLFGGASVDFYSMGSQAAQLSIKMLNNVPIKKLRIEDAEKTIRVINIKRAKQLNVKIPMSVINSLNAVY